MKTKYSAYHDDVTIVTIVATSAFHSRYPIGYHRIRCSQSSWSVLLHHLGSSKAKLVK
jgi:hypothetical protein